jgi:hypothetical protein
MKVLEDGLTMIMNGTQHHMDIAPELKYVIDSYLTQLESKFSDPNLSQEEFDAIL